MLKEWIWLCSLWLFSWNEFNSDRPVWPKKGVVDLVHGLPNRVLHTEVSNQAYQQHVQVLLSKPETTELRTWKKRTFVLNSISCNFCWVTRSNFSLCFQALLDLVWPFGKCVRFFSPPSCTHSCAVAERSKEKWMDLVYLGGGALRNLYGGFNSRFLLLIVLFQNK